MLVLSAAMASLASVPVAANERGSLPPRYQGIAAEQCLRDLDQFDGMLHASGFGVAAPESRNPLEPRSYFEPTGTPRRQIRTLRSAAYGLAMRGSEAQCQEILATMRDLYRRHQEALEGESADPDARNRWRRAHLAGAHPLAAMRTPIPATAFIGADLRNRQDERLGEIADVVINPADASVVFVLVARGGFLGLGRKLVATRWRDFRATGNHETFLLDVPASVFEGAPTVGERTFSESGFNHLRQTVDRFWDRTQTRGGSGR